MNGRDKPAGNGGRHAELLSALDSHDLASTIDPIEDSDTADSDVDQRADPADVFPQSVASGGPTSTGVILWTRLHPEQFDPNESLTVQVATDIEFADIVFEGAVTDEIRIKAHDYTIKVDLDGRLESDTEYYYRFIYNSVASRTGRCQTLPTPDSSPESVSFAVLTCQNYLNGYFPALHYVAEEDVDFVLHLGDFIYESEDGAFKGLGSYEYEGREKQLPSGRDRVWSLEDYRYLYRTYRSDRFLQEALENHTLIASWDDHEMVNDIYWDHTTDAPAGDHPRGDDPEFMSELVADGIHAWWEFMPARVSYNPGGESLQERIQLWRELEFGDRCHLLLTDERLFRDPPREAIPTADNVGPHREPPGRTMLGEEQREWLIKGITTDEAQWTVWADEVLTSPFRFGSGPLSVYPVQGGWDGYTRERQRITEAIAAEAVENFVSITGDMHCCIAAYLQDSYPGRVSGGSGVAQGKRIGVEFMTPATTSLNAAEALHLTRGLRNRLTKSILSRLVEWMNPHIEFFDSHHWGYSVIEFTPEECRYVAYAVDKTENSDDADKTVITAYRVSDGTKNLVEITEDYI
ncbi:alkaline phosphatase D family protein [Natronococcus jeotgali]|uniref:alkaline phosphatase D family protein n=1 Tax=Natronococcus jeotgali TaxID=413812 RepID=UPI0019553094|nr:alkaline phosphatase D family protein [Natronococcus jeotgali]